MAGDNDVDPSFALLPLAIRQRIDCAFDDVIKLQESVQPIQKKRKLSHSSRPTAPVDDVPSGGGFIPDSLAGGFLTEEHQMGGFMPDTPPAAGGFIAEGSPGYDVEARNDIPLSLIPDALQSLDLQPDDEDVLSVFRNAASGWGDPARRDLRPSAGDDDRATVSRKDWRAVCAALLDTGGHEDAEMESVRGSSEDGSNSADEYTESSGVRTNSEEEDSDEYIQGAPAHRRGRRKSGGRDGRGPKKGRQRQGSSIASSDHAAVEKLSGRQKRECLAAFKLFFPDVEEGALERQRIGIKDITRVADLLKEKISAEETVEMLAAFSSSGDGTMCLDDFERMMLAARLA